MKRAQIKSNISSNEYLMESEAETIRLEVKTDPEALRKQAMWCGVKPGMRLLDVACGPGKTTFLLHDMIQPGGSILGIDFSEERINYAKDNYGKNDSIEFHVRDLRQPLEDLGEFDLVWVRFVLEYYRKEALEIVGNLKKVVKPGGALCLLDIDYNCLSHYELSEEMGEILPKIMKYMDYQYNFDTFIGRKLYSFLYDNGFENIEVELMANNILHVTKNDAIKFDWIKKLEIAAKKAENIIKLYPGGYQGLRSDFKKYIDNPRNLSYSILLLSKGFKPIIN